MSTQPQKPQAGTVPKPTMAPGKVEVGKGKTEAHETKSTQSTSKMIKFCGINVRQDDLELKDTDCTLKLDDKLNPAQQFCVANLFVEYANLNSPDEIKSQLPMWPLKKAWIQEGHIPHQEKRTMRFRAILEVMQHQIIGLPEFKDFKGHIATIEYMSLLSEKVHHFVIKTPPMEYQLHH